MSKDTVDVMIVERMVEQREDVKKGGWAGHLEE